MSALPKTIMTPEEYLAFERIHEVKHEYVQGEIFAMTGASWNHNRIVANALASLHMQIRRGPCNICPSDMRVKSSPRNYHYPDVVVVCGDPQFEGNEFDTLLNPTVIIEVLSPSTEAYDRGKKFEFYRALPSLQEYLLIAQDRVSIDHYVRREGQWWLTSANRLEDTITLPSIDCTLALADVYEKIAFDGEVTAP